uniref:hypothetical protein n=2 Tax=Vibrio parahaemolyticus TaxID=670 RepID=UPI001E4E3CD5
ILYKRKAQIERSALFFFGIVEVRSRKRACTLIAYNQCGLSVENKIFAANHNDLCSNTALTKGWC